MSDRMRGRAEGDDTPLPEDLARAVERCEAARARSLAYAGKSEHMRRKLDAAVRSAENDVAILRYAIRESGQGAGTGGAAGGG